MVKKWAAVLISALFLFFLFTGLAYEGAYASESLDIVKVDGKRLSELKTVVGEQLKPKDDTKDTKENNVLGVKDIKGHWAENYITALLASRAISGYPDGTFRPDNPITRAEFAVILVKNLNLAPKAGKVFADTQNHWARDYIATAYAYGIINGYSDVKFGPDDFITREQMAVMLVKAKNLSLSHNLPAFADEGRISPWAYRGVKTAQQYNLIKGYPDNTFRPQGRATRAEAATVIVLSAKQ